MNKTSADDVIIQALWPGPGVPTEAVVRSFGILPSLSLSGTVGSPLVRYASRPATRCSNVGVGAGDVAWTAGVAATPGDGDGEGEPVWAKRDPLKASKQRTATSPPH